MAEFFQTTVHDHFNYWIYVILMMIGLWAVIAKKNFIKKLIGLSIFQTAIILFYVSIGVKVGASIPILHHDDHVEHAAVHETPHGSDDHKVDHKVDHKADDTHAAHDDHGHGHHADAHAVSADLIANPLPHVLMLTAIVVGVATLGVALALSQRIFKEFGTLEENELLEQLKGGNVDG
ncbi:cation:proton antiporter subunit C [Verrucomicrobiales bacterium]|nr:cation:proton antiporter subunit C [Verrucomicrobiales bacterium]|tara:strand:+ start:19 stop:552 length:534 start_codon:yes stop_codon:yes gene_type:complete